MLSGAGLIKELMESGRFHIAVKPHCLISPDNHSSACTHMLLAADSQCDVLKPQKKAVGCCGNSCKKQSAGICGISFEFLHSLLPWNMAAVDLKAWKWKGSNEANLGSIMGI